MEDMGLVILGQAVILLIFCIGPILVAASWLRRLGRRKSDDDRRRRAP